MVTFAVLPLTSTPVTLVFRLQRHALLLEDLGRFLADIAVHAGQQLVEIFDHGDLRAQSPPDRAQFQPDHAAADHDHALRHGLQFQRAGGIDDHAASIVDLDTGQRA